MGRFQRLTDDELQALEKEFVDFLSVQGITASDWIRIKEEEPERADYCIEQFSDLVYGAVMMRIEYLELRTPHKLYSYHCAADKINVMGLESDHPETDFTDAAFIERSITQPPADLRIFAGEKAYDGRREDEIFRMLSSGCTTADGVLFETLKKLSDGSSV
ncbi:MAG: DUF6495 family protein [Saprospiraceae bacterium]|nr:DUF6495 family protein [Saprospiraceae bacterium]